MHCQYCKTNPTRDRRPFCSIACFHRYHFEQRVANWLEGKDQGWRGDGTVKNFVKKWLIEQRGEACEKCAWAERHPTTGRIPIQVDHIDGDWRNNRPENLRVLCPNCHSLTPTYCGLNRGKGRDRKGKVARKQYPNATPSRPYRSKVKVPPRTKPKRVGNFTNKQALNFTKKELDALVWQKPTSHIASEYGVTDNAITKWCKKLGVEKPPRGYWAKRNRGKKHAPLGW